MLRLAEEIRAIATTGLNFARNPYDKDHYSRLLEIAAELYAKPAELPAAEVLANFRKELGYVTTKVGVNAAIFRGEKMLLERRADDGCWGIPGGWVDVNETPEKAVRREISEETGLTVESSRLVDIFSRDAGAFGQPHSSCHIQYCCSVAPGEPRPSHESLELAFLSLGEVKNWHRDHLTWADRSLRFYRELSSQPK